MQLRLGEERRIALPSLGAAGYQWSLELDPPEGPVAAQLVADRRGAPKASLSQEESKRR
jgi:hypothetical protein